jgi:hypothetical protein
VGLEAAISSIVIEAAVKVTPSLDVVTVKLTTLSAGAVKSRLSETSVDEPEVPGPKERLGPSGLLLGVGPPAFSVNWTDPGFTDPEPTVSE